MRRSGSGVLRVVTASGLLAVAAAAQGSQADAFQIRSSVLRHVVKSRCQLQLCLPGEKGKPVAESVLEELKPLGRVEPALPDDFEIEKGMARGFSRRGAIVLDLRRIKAAGSTALAEVEIYAGSFDASLCTYRLTRDQGAWVVSEADTRCTL